MADPLSEVVRLLHPRAVFANIVSGKGGWAVRYSKFGLPSFCIVLEGSALLAVDGHEPITISAGDFVLLPTTPPFTISSFAPAPPVYRNPMDYVGAKNELRYGDKEGSPEMRSLGGSFLFDCVSPELIVSILPEIVHVKASTRLTQLVTLVGEESADEKPGHEFMLSRLVELLLIEAMRFTANDGAPPGLLRGLGDKRLALALKKIHERIEHPWNVDQLAHAAALSRSVFFERFTRTVGISPMEYVISWRMELAKELLLRGELSITEIAYKVGYKSTSTFSTAFRRHAGQSPSGFVRDRSVAA
ncbi:MAG: AraC family transcriptional regulator [Nevskiaceae bacterium]|nr:MAG: AraC family transcriptional regulator [Nevskiaceae bacterium]